jgi:flagella basal body P-ring formation protein FlgA
MVRVFSKAQLGVLLGADASGLPDRICVQRKRKPIGREVWQGAVEAAMARLCPAVQWRVKLLETPEHGFPSGDLQFARAGVIASRGPVQLWRGALVLPDKSSIPVWVRLEIQTQRRAAILQRPLPAGAEVKPEDVQEEAVWASGMCREERESPRVEGMVVRRAMAAGAELTKDDLKRAPAVFRGQAVELEAASGTARLRVQAVAAHDAEIGETVQLKSTWNGTKLVGRVTGTQKAKVE